jgi:Ca2+/Na+ antiporter
MSALDKYITFIFIIKIIFIILAIVNLYLKKQISLEEKQKQEKQSDKIKKQIETQQKIEMLKTHVELLFKFLIALLIIYIFNPRENRLNLINYEAKVLFFLFGIILIFTANWKQIFKESPLVIYIQNVLHP